MNPETELDDARTHLREVERAMIEQLAREIKFSPEEGCKCIPVLSQVRWWLERRNDALYEYGIAVQGVEDASRTMINRRTGEPLPDLEAMERWYRELVHEALFAIVEGAGNLSQPVDGCECWKLHKLIKRLMQGVGDAQNDLSLAVPRASR